MRPYLVREGEHLLGISARQGFDSDEVWNHEDNRELRERRSSGQVLAAGDLLFVPEPPEEPVGLNAKTTNRYQVPMPRAVLAMTLRAGSEVLRNEPYRLEGLRLPREGTTDGEGLLQEELPAQLREVRLLLPNRDNFATVIRLGGLDPSDQPNGVRQRLQGIGQLPSLAGIEPYSAPPLNRDEREAETAAALRRFQERQGAAPTGEADPQTLSALEDEHGA